MQVRGARVLVTGANRGIGLAIAEALGAKGAHVLMGMRKAQPELAEKLLKGGAASARCFEMDLQTSASIESALRKIEDEHLEIDILVNNAGQLTGGLIEKQKIEDIYSMFQVNLTGLVHLTARLLPGMIARGRGKIVNNASVSGVMRFPCASTYAAAKTGVVAFTECIEQELRGTGVSTLVLLTPGVKTRMYDDISVKYGENLDLSFMEGTITTEAWAQAVVGAIEDDRTVLYPTGMTRLGLSLARHLPQLLNKAIAGKFKR